MFPFSVIKEQFGFSYMQNGVRFLSFSQPQAALTLHCGDSCFTFFTSINQPFFVRMFRQIIYIFILSRIMFVSKFVNNDQFSEAKRSTLAALTLLR